MFDRRMFLKGLASVGALGPLANLTLGSSRAAAATTPSAPPKRLVIFMQNNGTQQDNFWPNANFTSPILAPLLGNASVASKTNVIKGIYMPNDANGTDGNQHDMGFARLLSGAPLVSIGGAPWAGGPSVDQIICQANNQQSLTLAILASATEPHPKPGFNHRRSFSNVAAGTLKLPYVDPFIVYQSLFGSGAAPKGGMTSATKQKLMLEQSVLDAVAGDLADLENKLGPTERAKLDLHLTSVRQVETRLSAQINGSSPPVSQSCTAPTRPRDFSKAPTELVSSDASITELVTDMIDLASAALVCGMTQVATIQFGFGGGKWRFAWEGIDLNCHDDVAHLDTSDAGSSGLNTGRVVKMNHYYASQVARMAMALDAVPEGGGTMLDNTLIVWANELGRGNHSLANMPLVLIGKAGGALPRGGRLISQGPQIFNRVGCTILNLMGHQVAGFGDVPDCGSIAGL